MTNKKIKKVKPFMVYGTKYIVKYESLPPELAGLCDKANNSIFVADDLGKDLELKTMVHEATHALCHESGLDAVLSKDIEELICMMNERLSDIFKITIR